MTMKNNIFCDVMPFRRLARILWLLVTYVAYFPILKMEVLCCSETSVSWQKTRRHIPYDSTPIKICLSKFGISIPELFCFIIRYHNFVE
jgi:hypothetical protein